MAPDAGREDPMPPLPRVASHEDYESDPEISLRWWQGSVGALGESILVCARVAPCAAGRRCHKQDQHQKLNFAPPSRTLAGPL